jgi:hypothetical protein
MMFTVYLRHVTWSNTKRVKLVVKSSSHTAAWKLVLNNLSKYNLSYGDSNNLGYYVTRVIKA